MTAADLIALRDRSRAQPDELERLKFGTNIYEPRDKTGHGTQLLPQ